MTQRVWQLMAVVPWLITSHTSIACSNASKIASDFPITDSRQAMQIGAAGPCLHGSKPAFNDDNTYMIATFGWRLHDRLTVGHQLYGWAQYQASTNTNDTELVVL